MGGGSECAARGTREQTKIDRATVPARRDLDPRTSALCVRGSYYEYNVRGYAVIPGVDIRCHAFSHQYRVIKLNSTKKKNKFFPIASRFTWKERTLALVLG